jgi:hypothetical protein
MKNGEKRSIFEIAKNRGGPLRPSALIVSEFYLVGLIT